MVAASDANGGNASRVADRDGVTFLDLDVASDESVTAVVQVIERYGRLDVAGQQCRRSVFASTSSA